MSAASPLPHPLSPEQSDWLGRLTQGLDAPRLWWLSGYAAGLAEARVRPGELAAAIAQGAGVAGAPAAHAAAATTLTIVYGSQTGNARRVAEQLARQAEAAGLAVRVQGAADYPVRELKNERFLYVVISTQGDGDPPDDARGLFDFITGKRAPALKELKFAVLGLGDSSYPQFCEIGRRLDERLAELGATRLLARGDADLDIETVAGPWQAQALAAASEAIKPAQPLASVTPLRPHAAASANAHAVVAAAYDRDTPFAAELLLNQRLTIPGSAKDVRHIELSLEGSGLTYAPGDALGIWPRNPQALVQALLTLLDLEGDAPVAHAGRSLPLREWLVAHRELTRLSRPFLVAHAERSGDPTLQALLAAAQPGAGAPAPAGGLTLALLLGEWQLIDLLQRYPAAWTAEALVAALRPLTPRMYSIASSQKQVGEEAHLTVDHIEYVVPGGTRWGAASHLLAASEEGDRLPVFIERNERFRVPRDGSRDMLMIGPGTGVAPFRGFVQERAAEGATGRNWLFFGNPHFRTDFLYQVEWQQALKSGELHRIDLAFSRDQAEKQYVQHRLRERGRDVYDWLEGGAHLYVCGDASRMAKDVHAALRDLVAEHGGRDHDAAEEYLSELQQQGRYARDVY